MLIASLSVANTFVLGGNGQGNQAGPTVPLEDAEWTVMVYLDGDNNLEPYGLSDLAEMEAVGSVDGVNVIVLMDTYSAI
ncbi:MAG: clostripain-related cysteine peptidase, partial [Thermoplasmata archaeon]